MRTSLVLAIIFLISPAQAQFNRGPTVVVAEPIWKVESSDNFRVFHDQEGDYGKKVLKLADEYREEIGKRWFDEIPKFRTKCDIYLQTSLAHGSATRIDYDNGQALTYRIDLRIDLDNVYDAILPHEIMHALLGAYFERPIPRWADEGLASQNEPKETQEKAKKILLESKTRFEPRTLMTLDDYPRETELFYAQSIMAVNHLVRLRDEKTFILFITDAQKEGPESALQKHYKVDFASLEKTWMAISPPVKVISRGQ